MKAENTRGDWLRDSELAKRYGVSRPTIWRWVKAGILPAPVEFSAGCTRWSRAKIEQRDAEREAAA